MSTMSIYAAAVTLFLVMDPIGNIPAFLTILGYVDENRRRKIIAREMVIALAVLVLFLFFGKYILQGMHISEPALSIGGGVVLFLIAIRMIFPRERTAAIEREEQEPLIVPLAVPLVAGPSAMATVVLFANQAPGKMFIWFFALLIAWFASAVVLLSAETLRRRLGTRFLSALERLMGMILTTLAVQMLLTGIENYVRAVETAM